MDARGKNRDETISKLARRVDSFERYSSPHSELIAALAAILARRMGLGETDVAAIAEAGRMHDIGLYAMSPAYHSSSGSLDFEQRLDLWRHTVVGEQQMAKGEASRHTQLLVRWHHEWWNGTGYPDQLAFEDIPIGARILRAVELYCALISDRTYRAAFDECAAKEIVRASAGVECDPYVVAALLSLIEEPGRADYESHQQASAQAPVPGMLEQGTAGESATEISEAIVWQPTLLEQQAEQPPGENFQAPSAEPGSKMAGAAAAAERVDAEPRSGATAAAESVDTEPRNGATAAAESLLTRLRAIRPFDDQVGLWREWTASRCNRRVLLGFEASVLRQLEFRSIAVPYWSTARLDLYLKTWDKQVFANDASAWGSAAARAMVEAASPLTEGQILELLGDVYVPRARLCNRKLLEWFSETDAWWLDNFRRNVELLQDQDSKAQALLIGMQTGDYALSFNEHTRDLRQPLTTVFQCLAARATAIPGSSRNHISSLSVEEFIRQTRADLLYLKLPAAHGSVGGSELREAWRECWVTGGESADHHARPAPQSAGAYLAWVDRLLQTASGFKTWAIAYQETGLAFAHDVAETIKAHRPIRATYSKDLTEVLGGVRSFIIVADSNRRA